MRSRFSILVFLTACLLTACAPRVSTFSEYTNPDYDLRGLITTGNADVKTILKTILADSNDVRTDFRRIQDWVAASVVYDNIISNYWQRPSETIKTRRGDCKDYSTLLCTLWRAYGIPADTVYVAIGTDAGGNQHAFLIEKYLSGTWHVIEPQVGGFVTSGLGAIDTAEKYAIMYLFNDLEYSGKPYWIYSKIKGIDYPAAQAGASPAKKPLPLINSFTAVPARIASGQSSVLKWDVTGADYIALDQGIGRVDPVGTAVVYPIEDTEYRVVAKNDSGTLNSSAMVKVIQVSVAVHSAQSPATVIDARQPMTIGFAGWFIGEENVSTARVGQQVTARINMRGGEAGQCIIRIWRSVTTGRDDIVTQWAFSYDGKEAAQRVTFAPSYAIGESGTLGYRIDMIRDAEQIWVMPEGYPPRLTVAPRPVSGPLVVNFAGWRSGIDAVSAVNKGQPVVGSITLTGGNGGQYTLQIKRDVEGSNDQLVQQLNINYDGSSCVEGMMFTPGLATGESATRGYYMDLYQANKFIWSLSGTYPPRLKVTQQ
jgi:hypothetical protein